MAEEPVLLKILKLLNETRSSLNESEIAARLGEDTARVKKALEALIDKAVLDRSAGYYQFCNTAANRRLLGKMTSVYDKVIRAPKRESLVVGLLATSTDYRFLLSRRSLLKEIEEQGFETNEVNKFLEDEIKTGRVGLFRIALVTRSDDEFRTPPVLPFHYTARFRRLEPEEYRELSYGWQNAGLGVREEDYLISNYPEETAAPAIEFVENEAHHMRDWLREEALTYPVNLKSEPEINLIRWPTIFQGYSHVVSHYLLSPSLDTIAQ